MHLARCKNTRIKSKNPDSSKNVSVVNTFTDIGDIAATALMNESNDDQDLPDWNEVLQYSVCLNHYVLSLKVQE